MYRFLIFILMSVGAIFAMENPLEEELKHAKTMQRQWLKAFHPDQDPADQKRNALNNFDFSNQNFNDKGFERDGLLRNLKNYSNILSDELISNNRVDFRDYKKINGLLKIEILNFNDNRLREIPQDLCRITQMKSLCLKFNRIRQLPSEIGNLTNLEDLDLTGNRLTQLPSEIGNLRKLNYLNLESGDVNQLPHEVGNLTQLTFLDLRGNELINLPPEICQLTHLQWLAFMDNENLTISPELAINLINLPVLEQKWKKHLFKHVGEILKAKT